VRTSLVVILLVGIEQMTQMPFAEHDNMVKTIPSDRTDQPLRISVLPWRLWRNRPIPYAHCSKPLDDDRAIDAIPIARGICCRRLRSVDGQSNGRSGVRSHPATEAGAGNAARSEIHTTAQTRSSGLRTNPSTRCRRRDCVERFSSPAPEAASSSPCILPRWSARHRCQA